MNATQIPRCPHCGQELKPFSVPEDTSWDEEYHWACFNDECPYFVDGWDWMMRRYSIKASYRYRITRPGSTNCLPLAVPTRSALVTQVVDPQVALERD